MSQDQAFFEHETEELDADKAAKRLLAAYRDLFDTGDGRIVLADLIRFCGVFAPLSGRTDAETNVCLGKRIVGVRILEFSGKLTQMLDYVGM